MPTSLFRRVTAKLFPAQGGLGGVYRAIVIASDDPTGEGRIRVRLATGEETDWAPVVSSLAGGVPGVGGEVIVAFERGDLRYPIVLGLIGTRPVPPDAGDGASVTVGAASVTITGGTVQVNAGMARFSGVLQCDTLIANSVVASSYTPGAGNLE